MNNMFIVLSLTYICYMLVICCLLASRLAPEAAVPCCGPTGALNMSEMMGKTWNTYGKHMENIYGTYMEHIWNTWKTYGKHMEKPITFRGLFFS